MNGSIINKVIENWDISQLKSNPKATLSSIILRDRFII